MKGGKERGLRTELIDSGKSSQIFSQPPFRAPLPTYLLFTYLYSVPQPSPLFHKSPSPSVTERHHTCGLLSYLKNQVGYRLKRTIRRDSQQTQPTGYILSLSRRNESRSGPIKEPPKARIAVELSTLGPLVARLLLVQGVSTQFRAGSFWNE